MASVYGPILPGYGPPPKLPRTGVFFVIGPETQLAAYERYLQSVEGVETKLFRLHPRDFWLPDEEVVPAK